MEDRHSDCKICEQHADRIAALEADLQAALDTVHAWEGTTCGGDCLAAPCGSCDGTGRTQGWGERLAAELAELKDDLAAKTEECEQLKAERDYWMRLWLKPEQDAARKEGTK